MAAELQYRHTAKDLTTMRATIRQERTTGTKIRMWNGSTWENLTVANWSTYLITLSEDPASSYGYVGSWPATLTTAGWYYVDIYSGTDISSPLEATLFGYWDGTNFLLGGADTREVSGDSTAADNLEAVLDGNGGVGLTLNKLTIAANDATGAVVITNSNISGSGLYVLASGDGMTIAGYDGINVVGTTGNGLMAQGSQGDLVMGGVGTISNGASALLSATAVAGVTASTLSTLTGAAAADAVWDEATSGHTASGSFGKLIGTTWAALFTGITSMANWLRALARSSTPDSTALSEINTSGGTYDATTDSLEATGTKLTSTAITVVSPTSSDDTVTIEQNRDYTAGSYALSWTVAGYDGPSTATSGTHSPASAVFVAQETKDYQSNRANVALTKSFTFSGTDTLTISGTLSSSDTSSLLASPPADQPSHKYDLYLLTSGASPQKVPLITGADLIIKKNIS